MYWIIWLIKGLKRFRWSLVRHYHFTKCKKHSRDRERFCYHLKFVIRCNKEIRALEYTTVEETK